MMYIWCENPYILVRILEDFEDDQIVVATNMSYLQEKSLIEIALLKKKYWIELHLNKSKSNTEWNLHLHIDSVVWFDMLIINTLKKKNERQS